MNEDKSARYHRLKRRIAVGSLIWSASVLVVLLVSGSWAEASHAIESWLAASGAVPRQLLPLLAASLDVLLLFALNELGSLPLGFYGGFLLERRYNLSTQTLRHWLADQGKGLALGFVLASLAVAVTYALIRRFPDTWWLAVSILFALFMVVMAGLAPIVLLPLFYAIKPLDRKPLETRLLALAERAGARVLGAYEWGLGAETRKANAALIGVGATRRILVSDTMLAGYSDDEIEVVLAHELAHHVHRDIWRGLALETCLMLLGAFAASHVLSWGVGRFGIHSRGDMAGLPLLALTVGAVSLLLMPVGHALSRLHERRADHFALTLTRNPVAFVSAMKRLAAQNLAEDDPSALVRLLFYSHPPIRERIEAAQRFSV